MWNWDSMGEGGTCLVPSIAISSSLLCLAGCLFTTVWQEALSLCQLISHFSINIIKWPIFLFASFYIKKNVCCYPGEVDLIRHSRGKILKFPEMLRGVWHLLVMWTVLLPGCQTALPPDHNPSTCIQAFPIWAAIPKLLNAVWNPGAFRESLEDKLPFLTLRHHLGVHSSYWPPDVPSKGYISLVHLESFLRHFLRCYTAYIQHMHWSHTTNVFYFSLLSCCLDCNFYHV